MINAPGKYSNNKPPRKKDKSREWAERGRSLGAVSDIHQCDCDIQREGPGVRTQARALLNGDHFQSE